MKIRKYRKFVADFETTVYSGQKYTEVWAAALVELYTEDVTIDHSLPEFLERLKQLKSNAIVYFHNLKFDGNFILDYLLRNNYHWNRCPERDMLNNDFKASISDRGQWYTITIKMGGYIIEIRDSLKLLPFSVKRIGKSFATKHKKLDMEYEGFRYAGCPITEEEKKYIANDVLVVKEALEIMFSEGHEKLTIGSCCMDEFKKGYDKQDYETFFQSLQRWCCRRSTGKKTPTPTYGGHTEVVGVTSFQKNQIKSGVPDGPLTLTAVIHQTCPANPAMIIQWGNLIFSREVRLPKHYKREDITSYVLDVASGLKRDIYLQYKSKVTFYIQVRNI